MPRSPRSAQDGPLRDKPAHDLTVQALAGVAALNLGLVDGKPAAPGMPAADAIASLTALSAILMALLRRERSGEGEYIDISMYDALLAWTPNVTGPVFADDAHPDPANMRSFGGAAMYRIYETADGQFLVLGGSEVKFARNLLAAFDRPDLMPACELEPGPGQAPLRALLYRGVRHANRGRTGNASWRRWTAVGPLCVPSRTPSRIRTPCTAKCCCAMPTVIATSDRRSSLRANRRGHASTSPTMASTHRAR